MSAAPLGSTARPLQGTYTALVTPFDPDGVAVDHAALEALVDEQVAAGVDGLVACGTTGEAPTLSDAEHAEVIRRVVKTANGRVPVIAGTGSFSTKKTIVASRAALAEGADAVMVVMPYYIKPSQDGLRDHVIAVAHAVEGPIVLYNIPGRSAVDLGVGATEQIAQAAANVVAIKEATGNVLRCQEIIARLGDRLTIMSGDDALTLPMMSVGARGVISVTSNVRPRETSEVTRRALAGDWEGAKAAHFALLELHRAMFIEPNPAPAKAALAHMGKMSSALRLPLVAATESALRQVREALARMDR